MQLAAKVNKDVVYHWHHPKESNKMYENGYFKLADHFKWALSEVCCCLYMLYCVYKIKFSVALHVIVVIKQLIR